MTTYTVEEIDYHRNGCTCEGFHVVKFTCSTAGKMLGFVFEESGHVAVVNRDKIAKDDITFGSNSWRGDHYESFLRNAIKEKNDKDLQEMVDRNNARDAIKKAMTLANGGN